MDPSGPVTGTAAHGRRAPVRDVRPHRDVDRLVADLQAEGVTVMRDRADARTANPVSAGTWGWVLVGRSVPSSLRSSRTAGRPTRSIFLRTWPSSLRHEYAAESGEARVLVAEAGAAGTGLEPVYASVTSRLRRPSTSNAAARARSPLSTSQSTNAAPAGLRLGDELELRAYGGVNPSARPPAPVAVHSGMSAGYLSKKKKKKKSFVLQRVGAKKKKKTK